MSASPRTTATGGAVTEWAAAAAVAVASIGVVARVATSARSVLLFSDGDSMLPVLVMRSLSAGQPQDWAMSPVLFVPELAAFGLIWLLGVGADATIAIAGVVNLVGLYLALRVAAGSRRTARSPVVGALSAFTAFCALALLDSSASRDSFELASLLTTTTYYAATVVAVVLAVGLARRAAQPVRHPTAAVIGLGAVATVSVASNPLFLLWATAPLCLILLAGWLVRGRRIAAASGAALLGGSVVGYLARLPLAHLIANDGLGYVDVSRAGDSLGYYSGWLAERWNAPGGPPSILIVVALTAVAVVATVRLPERSARGAMLVAVAGWLIPAVVLVAAIVLGTHATRYLQPVMFAPAMALVVLPELVRSPRPRPAVRRALAATAVLALGAVAAIATPALARVVTREDPDLACVTSWVDDSGRVGAGQFWTVRLPKAHLADPRGLVQVDTALNPYAWLVNRDDARIGEVSFLLLDGQSYPFALPDDRTLDEATAIDCGRYRIEDFGDRPLRLGAPRS